MPELLPAHDAHPSIPPNDAGLLLLRAEDVNKDIIEIVVAIPLGDPQRAAISDRAITSPAVSKTARCYSFMPNLTAPIPITVPVTSSPVTSSPVISGPFIDGYGDINGG